MKSLATATAMSLLLIGGCSASLPAMAEVTDISGTPLRKIVINTQGDYAQVAKTLVPGDVVVLANGVWRDFDFVIEAQGTEKHPIYFTAETPGQVILSGQSSLRVGGEYIIVSGLVFRDGYSPRNEVISFRRDSKTLANNSRITRTVIENYNNPDRAQRDTWVVMYGRGNTFDHNHLSGKLNSGPTMTVRLNTEDSQENGHRIHNNYFGPRPVFGSNGGETLRIGTSQYSLTTSGTLVENNYFDRCSGEVEIISNKSGGNTYRNNTFFESRGTLTLRHGNGTLVENNLFDGNGAPYTGGVRVINARQTVRNNIFRDLQGERFSGALVVMNGVPNSPINRYHQVDGAVIANNTFEGIAKIELAEGSDKERSAVPINSSFQNNIIVAGGETTPFSLYDDLSGIAFANNYANVAAPTEINSGFSVIAEGDTPPTDVGAQGSFGVAKSETGVPWHPKPYAASPFGSGHEVLVQPGENALSEALANAGPGDTLILGAGDYSEAKAINLQIPLTIKAETPGTVRLSFERRNLFLLSSNGALKLEGLEVTGTQAPDAVGNSFIASTARGGSGNHVVEMHNMVFDGFVINRGFSIVSAAKGTFFDRVTVTASQFRNISGVPFKFDTETDDYGIYNIEYLIIDDSTFENVGGSAASVYRGGRDESTFGPHVHITGSTFKAIGGDTAPLLALHGVQNVKLTGNTASEASPAKLIITTGKPKVTGQDNQIVTAEGAPFLIQEDLR